MGEVDGHKGVAVVLHVLVHAETSPVVSVNVANCGRGGEGSVSCRRGETEKVRGTSSFPIGACIVKGWSSQ